MVILSPPLLLLFRTSGPRVFLLAVGLTVYKFRVENGVRLGIVNLLALAVVQRRPQKVDTLVV